MIYCVAQRWPALWNAIQLLSAAAARHDDELKSSGPSTIHLMGQSQPQLLNSRSDRHRWLRPLGGGAISINQPRSAISA
ncbi:hypothetical protein LZ31DRAFT_552892 [Colletotrichum somersetense]|nr:hypothetical protein LZ31DRAFT_552892 [Colletotrichum somersetense]